MKSHYMKQSPISIRFPSIHQQISDCRTPQYRAASAAYSAAYAAALCCDPPPGVSGAALYAEAQCASELAAACAEDLAWCGMAASTSGLPVDWETAYAEADAWQEGQEACMAHVAEMDALHSTGRAGWRSGLGGGE